MTTKGAIDGVTAKAHGVDIIALCRLLGTIIPMMATHTQVAVVLWVAAKVVGSTVLLAIGK